MIIKEIGSSGWIRTPNVSVNSRRHIPGVHEFPKESLEFGGTEGNTWSPVGAEFGEKIGEDFGDLVSCPDISGAPILRTYW